MFRLMLQEVSPHATAASASVSARGVSLGVVVGSALEDVVGVSPPIDASDSSPLETRIGASPSATDSSSTPSSVM